MGCSLRLLQGRTGGEGGRCCAVSRHVPRATPLTVTHRVLNSRAGLGAFSGWVSQVRRGHQCTSPCCVLPPERVPGDATLAPPIPALRAAPPAPRPPERPQHRPGAGVASRPSLSPVSLIANGPDDLCVLGGRKLAPFSTAPLPSSVGRNSLHSPDIDPMLVSDSAGVFMHLRLTRASRVQTNWEALQPRLVSPSGGSLPVPSPQATRPALLHRTLNGPTPFSFGSEFT